jgi:hypothetical protein
MVNGQPGLPWLSHTKKRTETYYTVEVSEWFIEWSMVVSGIDVSVGLYIFNGLLVKVLIWIVFLLGFFILSFC